MSEQYDEYADAPVKSKLTVSLLGREFNLACTIDEQPALRDSVAWVNERLEALRETMKTAGNERIALLAALQIAHEVRNGDGPRVDESAIRTRIEHMQTRIDHVLGDAD